MIVFSPGRLAFEPEQKEIAGGRLGQPWPPNCLAPAARKFRDRARAGDSVTTAKRRAAELRPAVRYPG
jgi:hypothetical protein